MKIVVCFKVVPDFEQVLKSDWENFSSESDLNCAKRIINCFDETALELALRIKDDVEKDGGFAECTALTFAGELKNVFSSALFAAGFDRVELIKDEGTCAFNSLSAAKNLAGRIKEISPDLVLTGKQAGYADGGVVPFYIAERLKLRAIGEAFDAGFAEGVFFADIREPTGGIRRCRIDEPAVVSVGTGQIAGLRITTLKKRLATVGKNIDIFSGATACKTNSFSEIKFEYKENRRECKMLSEISEFTEILKGSIKR
ncbi:MAG: hypothetical protein LBQ27_05630 [Clostridiales bacterium]|jgi:electron transfer flavoprotein beta subunit|nr:hypothetical protein [Clostridiales bacterium]